MKTFLVLCSLIVVFSIVVVFIGAFAIRLLQEATETGRDTLNKIFFWCGGILLLFIDVAIIICFVTSFTQTMEAIQESL